MTYSINIVGHKDTGSPEESREFEEAMAADARIFVASLEGVTSATGSFGSIGTVNLLAQGDEHAGS